jgi:hypothetical protein
MFSFPPHVSVHTTITVQVFLAVLARDYEWECNADEEWITAENQRCADLPVAFACLRDRAGMLNARTSSIASRTVQT